MTTYPDLARAGSARIEIPAHYDLWMRGARFGVIRRYHRGIAGAIDYVTVKMDNPRVKRLVRLPRSDWQYVRVVGVA